MPYRTVTNQTLLERADKTGYAAVGAERRSMVHPQTTETRKDRTQSASVHRSTDYQFAIINPAATPTDAFSGAPGGFIPLGSNFANLAAVQGSGVIPSDADWDTKGDYLTLGDGSEAHYRLAAWSAGRVP